MRIFASVSVLRLFPLFLLITLIQHSFALEPASDYKNWGASGIRLSSVRFGKLNCGPSSNTYRPLVERARAFSGGPTAELNHHISRGRYIGAHMSLEFLRKVAGINLDQITDDRAHQFIEKYGYHDAAVDSDKLVEILDSKVKIRYKMLFSCGAHFKMYLAPNFYLQLECGYAQVRRKIIKPALTATKMKSLIPDGADVTKYTKAYDTFNKGAFRSKISGVSFGAVAGIHISPAIIIAAHSEYVTRIKCLRIGASLLITT